MAVYKVTRLLRHKDSGWSESYYCEAASHTAATAAALAINAAVMRVQVEQLTLTALRLSLVGTRREAIHINVPAAQRVGSAPLIAGVAPVMNLAHDSLLLTFLTGTWRFKNRKFLRGVPDQIFVDNAAVPTLIANYAERITGEADSILSTLTTWGFRARVKQEAPMPPGFAYWPITGITIERATSRRVGRPFALPVGRRTRRP